MWEEDSNICGIVGIIGANNWTYADDFMEDALVVDAVRGPHSTGMLWVNRRDEAYYFKQLGSGSEFIETSVFQEAVRPKEGAKFLCGHNRYATKGAVSEDNAHPFSHNGVTGIHNGTLTSYAGLTKPKHMKGRVEDAFGTDSETVIYTLSVSPDPKQVLKELDGAFVLVWHDQEDNCVRMVRNYRRPLWLAKLANRDTVVYGSEKKMLEWLVDRNKGTIESMEMLPAGEIWRFDLNQTAKKMIKPFVQKITLKKTTSYQSSNWPHYNRSTGSTSGTKSGGTNNSTGTTQTSTTTSPSNNVVALPNNRQKEPVQEFLRRHGITKPEDDLYAEVMDVRTTSSTHRIVGLCELGTESFNVVLFIPRAQVPDVSNDFLRDNLLCITGPAVAVEPDILGESAVILNVRKGNAIDHEWNLVYGGHPDAMSSTEKDWLEKSHDPIRKKIEALTNEFYGTSPLIVSSDDDDPGEEYDRETAERLLVGPDGEYVPKSTWLNMTSQGCMCCHSQIKVEEAELVEWVGGAGDNSYPICHHCQGLDFLNDNCH